jgi:hypothetical protein
MVKMVCPSLVPKARKEYRAYKEFKVSRGYKATPVKMETMVRTEHLLLDHKAHKAPQVQTVQA